MLLFVRTRTTGGSNYTHVSIPGDYTLYEASYSHYGCNYGCWYYDCYTSYLKVDGITIDTLSSSGQGMGVAYKQYDESTLTVGSPHTIEITYSPKYSDGGSAGVANVLIYKSA